MSEELNKLLNTYDIIIRSETDAEARHDKIFMEKYHKLMHVCPGYKIGHLHRMFDKINSIYEMFIALKHSYNSRYKLQLNTKQMAIIQSYFENIQKNRILKCLTIEKIIMSNRNYNPHKRHILDVIYDKETNCCENKCQNCLIENLFSIKSREI